MTTTATPSHTADPTITERDAARYIGMSTAYLRQGRRFGKGPAYIRMGRAIRYRIRDLDAWLESHLVQPGTHAHY